MDDLQFERAEFGAAPPARNCTGCHQPIAGAYFDVNFLGQLGAIPGWPGADVAPPQPMIGQTRAVLDAYAAKGGNYREVALENCGHSPHLEHPDAVRTAILEHLSRWPGRP